MVRIVGGWRHWRLYDVVANSGKTASNRVKRGRRIARCHETATMFGSGDIAGGM